MNFPGLKIFDFIPPYIGRNRRLAVGVSGGADSLYLTLLLNQWCEQNSIALVALTVDHQLRPESAEEAKWLKGFLQSYSIQHETLNWKHTEVVSKIQEEARTARYDLLVNYCKQHGISAICMAHHLDDQWETFMMRLAHGSGGAGLGAMSSVSTKESIFILRPLLHTPKKQIISELEKSTSTWIEDPSNKNAHYERIRFRKEYKVFQQLGLSSENIVKSIVKLQQDDNALDFYATQFMSTHVVIDSLGFACISFSNFKNLPFSIQYKVAVKIGSMIGGRYNHYPPRTKTIALLLKIFPQTTTGMGCLWMVHKQDLYVIREHKRINQDPPIMPDETVLWDNRLFVKSSEAGTLRALGERGWRQIKNQLPAAPPIPIEAIYSSVALWNKDEVINSTFEKNSPLNVSIRCS